MAFCERLACAKLLCPGSCLLNSRTDKKNLNRLSLSKITFLLLIVQKKTANADKSVRAGTYLPFVGLPVAERGFDDDDRQSGTRVQAIDASSNRKRYALIQHVMVCCASSSDGLSPGLSRGARQF